MLVMSTIELIFRVRQIIGKYREKKSNLGIIFIDLRHG